LIKIRKEPIRSPFEGWRIGCWLGFREFRQIGSSMERAAERAGGFCPAGIGVTS
jgi:hypothetical protein